LGGGEEEEGGGEDPGEVEEGSAVRGCVVEGGFDVGEDVDGGEGYDKGEEDAEEGFEGRDEVLFVESCSTDSTNWSKYKLDFNKEYMENNITF
jgi:hypothetical protein